MEKVIIVIPTHKNVFNKFEKISLTQLQRVLEKYPKVFVVPERLDESFVEEWKGFSVKKVCNEWFGSTIKYNKMCLSPKFYELFSDYEYMLIYQTDAFVFSDRLEEFCDLGYDYIGAPVTRIIWKHLGRSVGNGGFSLRNINATIKILQKKEDIFEIANLHQKLLWAEDQFFAFAGRINKTEYKLPSMETAIDFSLEDNIMHSFKKMNLGMRPFGCHAWYKNSFSFWWPLVKQYGYQAGEEEIENHARKLPIVVNMFFQQRMARILKYKNQKTLERISDSINKLFFEKKCRMWGCGIRGRRFIKLSLLTQIELSAIYDEELAGTQMLDGMVIQSPTDEHLLSDKGIIVITPNRFKESIADRLLTLGMKRGKDFITYDDLIEEILLDYYGKIWRKITLCK